MKALGETYVYDDLEADEGHHCFLLHADYADTIFIDVVDTPYKIHDHKDRVRYCKSSVNARRLLFILYIRIMKMQLNSHSFVL